MSIAELIPTLKGLPREDKIQVLRLMASDLTEEAGVEILQNGTSYPVWTPFDAHEAAQSLQKLLEEDRVQK